LIYRHARWKKAKRKILKLNVNYCVNVEFVEKLKSVIKINQLVLVNDLNKTILTKTKSMARGQDPENQTGRLPWLMVFRVEKSREVMKRG